MGARDDDGLQRVVWPRGRKTVAVKAVAPRLSTLDGKTIAELWDDLFRGDEIFPVLREALRERFPGVRFVGYETFGSTHGAREHEVVARLPERLREHGVDAVISGMAC
jgi:UDP:flavonoid glycosyltransferase YjiC (YdhE family)